MARLRQMFGGDAGSESSTNWSRGSMDAFTRSLDTRAPARYRPSRTSNRSEGEDRRKEIVQVSPKRRYSRRSAQCSDDNERLRAQRSRLKGGSKRGGGLEFRFSQILLQKSQKALRPILRQRTKQARIADQCSLKAVPGIAGEFAAWRRSPPHHYSIVAPTARRI